MGSRYWKFLGFGLLTLGVSLTVAFGSEHLFPTSGIGAHAQISSPTSVAAQVYESLPELPQENQYIGSEDNQPATNSTLVSRLIRYHTTVKNRSPIHRLDWKITLADYLGINDYLLEETYPGHGFLKTNPMENDIAAMQTLNRAQRFALIQSLVDIYTDGSEQGSSVSSQEAAQPSPVSTPTPPSPITPRLSPLRTPGGADQLAPRAEPNPKPTGDARLLLPE